MFSSLSLVVSHLEILLLRTIMMNLDQHIPTVHRAIVGLFCILYFSSLTLQNYQTKRFAIPQRSTANCAIIQNTLYCLRNRYAANIGKNSVIIEAVTLESINQNQSIYHQFQAVPLPKVSCTMFWSFINLPSNINHYHP